MDVGQSLNPAIDIGQVSFLLSTLIHPNPSHIYIIQQSYPAISIGKCAKVVLPSLHILTKILRSPLLLAKNSKVLAKNC